jgi:hypothetical protein
MDDPIKPLLALFIKAIFDDKQFCNALFLFASNSPNSKVVKAIVAN